MSLSASEFSFGRGKLTLSLHSGKEVLISDDVTVSGAGYARAENGVTFPAPTANWGSITGVCVFGPRPKPATTKEFRRRRYERKYARRAGRTWNRSFVYSMGAHRLGWLYKALAGGHGDR